MRKAEILEELPKLKAAELREIHDRILQLQQVDLLSGRPKPSEEEKVLLDRELEDYSRNPDARLELGRSRISLKAIAET